MLDVYGIRNCNTVKKALAWLDEHGVDYRFHDLKREGVDEDRLRRWVEALGWEALLNRKGLTWRRLSEDERARVTDAESAMALMREKPTIIKRPVVERDGEAILLGFDADAYAEALGG